MPFLGHVILHRIFCILIRVGTCFLVFIDRACMFQDCKEGRKFCEFSKTQLKQLQGVYNNYTSTLGSGETGSTEKLYVMPKVKELLSVLKKEYGNAQNSGELVSLDNCNKMLANGLKFLAFIYLKAVPVINFI